jgi:Zn-dependent peptidase ImmA (M78 family)
MATDIFVSDGLNTRQMAEFAAKYRDEFDVLHVELIDIVNIIEFKLPEIFPGFRLVIKPDKELEDFAVSEPQNLVMKIKESVYDGACEGDAFCRFTLAHELGHYLLHASKNRTLHKTSKSYSAGVRNMTSAESAEIQADMFAAHFLIVPSLAFSFKDNPVELARRAKVPLKAAKTIISASKRSSLRSLTHKRAETFAEKRRRAGDELFSD